MAEAKKSESKPAAKKSSVKTTDDIFSVPVRRSLSPAAPEAPAKEDVSPQATPSLTSHHELVLDAPTKEEIEKNEADAPSSPAADVEALAKDPEAVEPKEPEVAVVPETTKEEPAAAMAATEDVTVTADGKLEKANLPTDDSASAENLEEENSGKKQKPLGMPNEKNMQAPKVFDTTEYHLPIVEKNTSDFITHVLWFITIFIIVVILGILAAVDAEKLDIGIELPFDLIK